MDHGMFYSMLGMSWVIFFALIMLLAWAIRNKQRQQTLDRVHEERIKAIEKGIELPNYPAPDPSWMDTPQGSKNPRVPLGLGAVFIMGGFGLSLAFLVSNDPGFAAMWGLGFIGVFVGIGLILYYFLTRSKDA